jgi:hypothetical protein
MRVSPFELGVALAADDEESLGLMNVEQSAEVQVPAIEQVIRARLDAKVVQDVDLVGLAVGRR